MKKLIAICSDILLGALVIVALIIILPNLFGVKTLAVLSGSMEPNIHTGSMIFVAPTEPEKIEVGDPITFVLDNGTVVTHRVVAVDREQAQFTVKGDANNASDAKPVPYSNVKGVARFTIPIMGYFLGFVLTTKGKIITGTIIVSVILVLLLLDSGGNKHSIVLVGPPQSKKGKKKSQQPDKQMQEREGEDI